MSEAEPNVLELTFAVIRPKRKWGTSGTGNPSAFSAFAADNASDPDRPDHSIRLRSNTLYLRE